MHDADNVKSRVVRLIKYQVHVKGISEWVEPSIR